MSVENLSEEFQRWNPMENDYKSKEFNQYNTGPGANLDAALQPCEQANNRDSKAYVQKDVPTPYLMFKNMPPKMTKSALHNICLRHGKVTAVRDSQKCDYFFADFATVADMEATFRALENNNYGFKVFVGRYKKQSLPIDHRVRDNKVEYVAPRTTGIDYQNRTYRVSGKQHPRPSFDHNPLVSGEHYKGLPSDVLNNDAHSLEREGLHVSQKNDKFMYQTGRSYIVMPQSIRDFVNKKNAESSGRYSPTRDMYISKMDGVSSPSNFDKCVYCSRECDNICSRCSSYYCSVECQKSDWQQHRFVCGKPKNAQKSNCSKKDQNPSDLSAKEAIRCKTEDLKQTKSADTKPTAESNVNYNPQLPRSGNIVTITAISKTNIVFIRSKTYEENMCYFKTVDGLQAAGKNLKPLTSPPQCGNVVVAKFDNQFNRALVLNANNPEKIFVNYMDYGNLDGLKMEDLYEAPEEFAQKPRHAIPVMLKGVPDCYMTDEIRNFMYSYLNGISVYIKYKPEDYNKEKQVYQVELVDETTQQNLNKMIFKLSKPTEPKNTNDICYKEYLEQKPLLTGNNIELIVMDNSLMSAGCISCTTKPFAVEIQKFQKELQRYVESLPKDCYAPRADELCIAKYNEDGLWYRGRCLEVVGDGHPTILFIDYGNISMIHINDIRRYPSQFTYPIYTADCEIKGLPETCSDVLVEKLEELIPHGGVIKCDNVVMASKEDHFYSISLPSVIQKLSESSLL